MGPHLAAVDRTLAGVPGVVSVWCGRPSRPAYTRAADVTHPAASTMKVAVLAALYRAVDAGTLDLNATVRVCNEFASARSDAPPYGCDRGHDSDDEVWQRLGSAVPLGWLAERMIVRSSNLATNLVLAEVGLPAVREALDDVGVRRMVVGRGIEDTAAAAVGVANEVTAGDLATLFAGLLLGTVASTGSCTAMLKTLAAQGFRDDLAAGLPPGTRVAYKNGWIAGVRHSAGIVFPDDAPPFVLAVCMSTPLAVNRQGDEACQIVSGIAAAAWADRSIEQVAP
jgi:beta-lactamase class A